MKILTKLTGSFFVVSATPGGLLDRAIDVEDEKHKDFFRLVSTECLGPNYLLSPVSCLETHAMLYADILSWEPLKGTKFLNPLVGIF